MAGIFNSGIFNNAIFNVGAPGPAPVVTATVRPSGGFPATDRGPTREQLRRSRIQHGLEPDTAAERIIAEVARRQAASLAHDEAQRQYELREELRIRSIEAQSAHYQALADQRQALIDAEIGLRLRKIQGDNDTLLLLLIAAAAT